MAEPVEKKKIVVLVVVALLVTVAAAYFGSIQASELAYAWLNVNEAPKPTAIIDLLQSVSQAGEVPKLTKIKIVGAAAIGLLITFFR